MKSRKTDSSIIYVNFAPYENAGKIFDFVKDNFSLVAVFIFNFHKLGNKNYNLLTVYKNKRVLENKRIFDYQIPETLVFILLPLRSAFIFFQILILSIYLRMKYGVFDYYFTVNGFTGWIGNWLKKIRVVKKTIFWVWDYYPPNHASKIVAFMRWLYWQFDKRATFSDTLVFLNKRIVQLRKRIGLLNNNTQYKIIPIGTISFNSGVQKPTKKSLRLVFIGVIKKSQGLDLIFDNAVHILKLFPFLELHVLGSGPDLTYFKKRSEETKLNSHYYGYVSDKKLEEVLKKCHIGIATYIPSKDNVSYYGDPSKIKQYLSFGLPVITTKVFDFSREIEKSNAGLLINYHKQGELISAIRKIINNYKFYKKGSRLLGQKYYYKKLYPEIFTPY